MREIRAPSGRSAISAKLSHPAAISTNRARSARSDMRSANSMHCAAIRRYSAASSTERRYIKTSPFANQNRPLGVKPFTRRATDGDHWLVDDGHGRLPALLIGGVQAVTPAAVVIPLDVDFAVRVDAAARLWRVVTGRPRTRPPDRLTRQRRVRLGLTLRALDGRLAGETYRGIAQGLFGNGRVPADAS